MLEALSDNDPQRLGPYALERVVGRGGMSVVYLGRAPDGTQVAVKRMLPSSGSDDVRRRFELEATVRLSHPNVVETLDAGVDPRWGPYIAFAWFEAVSLGKRLHDGPTPWPEVLRIAIPVAAGLAAAHAAGFIHRDLKPSNVLVDERGTVKVIDFGIALTSGTSVRMTGPNVVVGTPSYMAPEQIRGDMNLDARVDIWALGCLLYRGLAGIGPFRRDTPLESMLAVLRDSPEPMRRLAPTTPESLVRLVSRCLAKDPADRPATMELVRKELEAIAATFVPEGAPQAADPPETTPEVPSGRGRGTASARRVVALCVARSVDDPAALASAIEGSGGITYPVLDDVIVGVWGSRKSHGDELARSLRALRPFATRAAGLGLVLGEAWTKSDALVGAGVQSAEQLALRTDGGLLVDAATARALDGVVELAERTPEVFAVVDGPRKSPGALPFVGRTLELAAAHDALEQTATTGTPRSVLILGPPGIGKTRLCAAIGESARALGYVTASAELENASYGRPLSLFRDMLTRITCADRDEDGAMAALARFVGDGAPLDRDTLLLLARWQAPTRAPVFETPAIRLALWTLLEAVAQRRSLCLVLEDLQWADDASLGLVADLVSTLEDARLFIVATSRAELPRGWSSTIRLGPLGPEAVRDLAAAHLHTTPSEAAIARLMAHTGGHALFVDQVLREIQAAGGNLGEKLPLPLSVEAAVQAGLDRVTDVELEACRWAALLGRSFPAALMRELDASIESSVVDRLAARGLLVAQHRGTTKEYRIPHTVLADAIGAGISPEDARERHARIAAALTREPDLEPGEVAEHYALAGEHAQAADWIEHAVVNAERSGEYSAAPRLLARLDELSAAPSSLALYHAGIAAQERSDFEEVVRLQQRILDRATDALDRARAHHLDAAAKLHGADLLAAADAASRARSEAAASRDFGLATAALITECWALFSLGRLDDATRAVEEACNAAPVNALSGRIRARLESARGLVALNGGRYSEALAFYERGATIAREAGYLGLSLSIESAVADTRLRLGAYEAGMARLLDIAQRCLRLGRVRAANFAFLNAGDALTRLGRPHEGMTMIGRVGRGHVHGLDKATRAYVQLYLGRAHLAANEPERALEALAPTDAASIQFIDAVRRALRAEALRMLGRIDEALEESEHALRQRDALGSLPEDEGEVFLYRGRTLRAAGLEKEARAVLERGRVRLRACAAKIDDAAFAESFLEKVPSHRALLVE